MLKFITSWKKSIFWTFILFVLIEGWMEFAIAGIMNMHLMSTTSVTDTFSNFCGFVSMVLALALVPAILIYVYAVPMFIVQN